MREARHSLWSYEHQRDVGSFLPQGELAPVALFAEMPAVITPQYDHGVVPVRAVIQGVDYATEHSVTEMDRRKISLHSLTPLIVLDDFGMVVIRFGHSDARRRDISEVVLFDLGKLECFHWERLKILFRHVPRQVRPPKATSEKEWFVVLSLELADDPVGDPCISHLVVGNCQWRPIKTACSWNAVHRCVRGERVIGRFLLRL